MDAQTDTPPGGGSLSGVQPVGSEGTTVVAGGDEAAKPVPPRRGFSVRTVLREVLAILFWFYALVKLFVFDIDVYLLQWVSPALVKALQYKFVFLVGAIALIWLRVRTSTLLGWALYIVFYPIVLTCWEIPYLIWRQRSWILLISVMNSVLLVLRSAKYYFVTSTAIICALVLVRVFSSAFVIVPALLLLLGLICIIYIRSLIFTFRPTTVFDLYNKLIRRYQGPAVRERMVDKKIQNIPIATFSPEQLTVWRGNLQQMLLFNRAALFLAKRLKVYHDSRVHVFSFVLSLVGLIFLSVVLFAAVNLGICKLDGAEFHLSVQPSFFEFLWYSFRTYSFGSTDEIVPIGVLAKVAAMVECSFAIWVCVIFATLCFSVKAEKYKEELYGTITELTATGKGLEEFIEKEYSLNCEQAMREIGKLPSNFATIILWLSKGGE
jgi:hypothetical protein